MKKTKHLLSVDLESWVFSREIAARNLSVAELRELDDGYSVEALTYLLNTFKKYDRHITFFVVGKLEELYPGTLDRIVAAGHEVAWHTHTHPFITDETILRNELELSKTLLKKYHIKGFQAPAITFFKDGYKMLKEYGFTYSSSIYGNSGKIYDMDGVYEVPVSVVRNDYKPQKSELELPSSMSLSNVMKFGLPYGSSFFWSVLGEKYYERKLREAEKNGSFANLFIHEWQVVTPQSPAYKKDVNAFKHPTFLPYLINVSEMFEFLLKNFQFQRFDEYVESSDAQKRVV